MSHKYSEDIQKILTTWSEELQKRAEEGMIIPLLVENIQNLIASGDIANVSKIRSAVESGAKDVRSY
jgi:hypothetical protein